VPFEAVACAGCGSTDVQEVKPSTYFCNHCETVFKYVDPSRLVVEHSPSFCWCGNPIQVQCQLCTRGMCRQCDVSANQAAIYRSPGSQVGYKCGRTSNRGARVSLYGPGAAPGSFYYFSYHALEDLNVLPFPVNGFGYLHRDMDRRVCGPFLYLSELLSTMAVARGLHYKRCEVPVGHLCFACVAAAVPATVERIANREICESPGCADRPHETCGCCGGSFCEGCLTPRVIGSTMGVFDEVTDCVSVTRMLFGGFICGIEPGGGVRFPHCGPEGLCLPCLGEAIDKARELARQICEQEYQLQPAAPRYMWGGLRQVAEEGIRYEIPEITATTKKKRNAELSRRYETSAQYAKEINARAQDYVKGSKCERQKAFQDRKLYATYVILDERDKAVPAALSALGETR
jgi:hypothetical protein